MRNRITYRQKLRYLWLGGLVLLLLSYRFSVEKTIKEYKTYRQLRNTESNSADDGILTGLQSKNSLLDRMLDKYILDTVLPSGNLLGVTGAFCKENNLAMTEYKPLPAMQLDSVSVATRSITVSGAFSDCLRLIYKLETTPGAGRVSSVNFKSNTPPAGGETTLFCTLFIQNIIPDKNEKN